MYIIHLNFETNSTCKRLPHPCIFGPCYPFEDLQLPEGCLNFKGQNCVSLVMIMYSGLFMFRDVFASTCLPFGLWVSFNMDYFDSGNDVEYNLVQSFLARL